MKNSPHKRKHLQHKAIRAANILYASHNPKEAKPIVKPIKNYLMPLNVKKSIATLEFYKKHLERAKLHKTTHDSKRSTPGQIEGTSSIKMEKNPNKIANNWKSKDMEKTRETSRKMLKESHKHYKNAA
jgi:hypothetical protein